MTPKPVCAHPRCIDPSRPATYWRPRDGTRYCARCAAMLRAAALIHHTAWRVPDPARVEASRVELTYEATRHLDCNRARMVAEIQTKSELVPRANP